MLIAITLSKFSLPLLFKQKDKNFNFNYEEIKKLKKLWSKLQPDGQIKIPLTKSYFLILLYLQNQFKNFTIFKKYQLYQVF